MYNEDQNEKKKITKRARENIEADVESMKQKEQIKINLKKCGN